jgi:predicted NBD/HSP70 family sugar kinase
MPIDERSWVGAGEEQQPGSHALLRELNERLILDRLRASGTQSRAQLAQASGLTKPTVATALASLETAGLVLPAGMTEGQAGPAAFRYQANQRAGFTAAIDIGRSWVRISVTDLGGLELAYAEAPNRARSAVGLVSDIGKLATSTAASAGISWPDVVTTVVGSPGVFDEQADRVRFAVNLSGWGRRGLLTELRRALGAGVEIENDINLAAVGEQTFGAARGMRDFILLSVGTGVGMGIVLGGKLYRGFSGAAGEAGYLPVAVPQAAGKSPRPAGGRSAIGPGRGFLEEATAANGFLRDARESGLTAAKHPKDVFDLAAAGDPIAGQVVDREAERLGQAIAAAVALLDPQAVIISGGLGRNLEQMRPVLEETLRRTSPSQVPVLSSELDELAVVRGATATAVPIAQRLLFERRMRTTARG